MKPENLKTLDTLLGKFLEETDAESANRICLAGLNATASKYYEHDKPLLDAIRLVQRMVHAKAMTSDRD